MREVGIATAQGARDHMEDFVHVEQPFPSGRPGLYAAVFDGHGGDEVSRRAARDVHGVLAVELGRADIEAAFAASFRRFDETVSGEASGSTAVVALVEGSRIAVANVGDSHALLVSRTGEEVVTEDHRLTNENEYARVTAAGAVIRGRYACLPDDRGLMCTRSLGDRDFRRIGIIAEPAFSMRDVGGEHEWLVLGSDGVWDGLDAEDVARLVRGEATAAVAAERVRAAALAANSDNVAVVTIRL